MDAKKIGERLKELREKRGLRKTVVARDLGCSYPAICSWEYGERIPSDDMKKKIAGYYDVPISIFFDNE